jgi:hypothetical protein
MRRSFTFATKKQKSTGVDFYSGTTLKNNSTLVPLVLISILDKSGRNLKFLFQDIKSIIYLLFIASNLLKKFSEHAVRFIEVTAVANEYKIL